MNMFNTLWNKTQPDRNALINNNYLLSHCDSSQASEHEGETLTLVIFVDREILSKVNGNSEDEWSRNSNVL